MSDRPENPDSPENGKNGGWSPPETPGGWRAPSTAASGGWQPPAEQPKPAGWRVPALPQDIESDPADQGGWHLPNPSDTTFSPDDEIEIVKETEEPEAAVDAAAEAEPSILPFDDMQADAGDAAVDEAEAEPADMSLPFDAVSPDADEAVDVAAEGVILADDADDLADDLDDEDDEDDDDTVSMSELIALASLADDQTPADVVTDQPPPSLDPADDPVAYAREQLARLEAQQEADALETPAPADTVAEIGEPAAETFDEDDDDDSGALDPAEIARQQVAALRGGDAFIDAPAGVTGLGPEPPTTVAPTLTPQQDALLQQYRDTERQVAALKQRQRSGEIDDAQLKAELQQLMVLDENQVYWMMGVQSDAWYKFEGNEWAQATPPVMELAGSSAPTYDPQFDTSVDQGTDALGGDSLPTQATGTYNEGMPDVSSQSAAGAYMPLPQDVPQRDPDITMPNTGGINFAQGEVDLDATMPGAAYGQETVPAGMSQETMPSGSAGLYDEVSIPAPGQMEDEDAEPPSYDLDGEAPVYEDALARRQRTVAQTSLLAVAIVVGLLVLMSACGIGAGLMQYNNIAGPYRDQIAGLANYEPSFKTARILDAEGNEIVRLTSQQGGEREEVALSEISPHMVFAVVASENERFFSDPGWDPIAIGRAFLQNLTAGEIESGASTITQQIVRNLIVQDTATSAERKLRELVVAAEIARTYDKNFILELYLNEVFFGNQSYGVEAAAQFYFDKAAIDLNAAESAMLAGIIPLPASYDPVVDPPRAFARMDEVLVRMRQVGCLQFTFEPYLGSPFCINNDLIRLTGNNEFSDDSGILIERANVVIRQFRPREFTMQYPHFVTFVQSQVEQTFGADEMFRRGFQIHTTLVPRIQDAAQDTLTERVNLLRGTGLNSGAVLVVDPTSGEIRAMVGSPDFNNEEIKGQVNNVLQWHQPGSAIKPILYTAALAGWQTSEGNNRYYTPATIIWDVLTTYNTTPQYTPRNIDGRFRGPIALRYALQNSYNIPAVKTLADMGSTEPFRATAALLGLNFQPNTTFGLPSALGANEVRLYDMVQAYATLANSGQRARLFAVTRITDAEGNEISMPERPQATQAISPQVAFLMNDILSDNEARIPAFGSNSGLALSQFPDLVAAKTGTSNDSRDLWTIGYTTNMVVGVWMGHVDDNATTANTTVASIPVWNAVMQEALRGTQPNAFRNPGGIITTPICAETGTLFDETVPCPTRRNEIAWESQRPPDSSGSYVILAKVDTWTGLRKTEFCPDATEADRRFLNLTDPYAVSWLTSGSGAGLAQALGLTQPIQQLPGACTTNTNLPNVRINEPVDGAVIQGTVTIIGAATGPDFRQYSVRLASNNDSDNFNILVEESNQPRQAGETLATWDSTSVSNGSYVMRLRGEATNGGFIVRDIDIGVNNPQPTAAPTNTPAPTEIMLPTIDPNTDPLPFPEDVEPLPFEADAQNAGGPTPTVEVPGLDAP